MQTSHLHRIYPYHRWIRFLIVCEELSFDELNDLIDLSDFPGVDEDDYAAEAAILAPYTGRPMSDVEFSEWLCREHLDDFLYEDQFAAEAAKILCEPGTRRVVEDLACVRADCNEAEIARIVREVTGINVSPGGVTRFLRMYWSVEAIDLDGWKLYSELLPDEKSQQLEWRRRLDLHNINDIGFALWRSGHYVEIDREDAITRMRYEAYMRFMATRNMGHGTHTATAAKNWADIFASMDNKLQEQEAKTLVSTMVDRISAIGLAYSQKKLKSRDDLD